MQKGVPVVLIRCADPRITNACARLLNLDESAAIISNTGSIKYFLLGDRLSDLYEQIHFLVHKLGAQKIILTNHSLCRFYEELSLGKEAQLADLKNTKRKLQELFPEIETKVYYIDTETSESASVE
ncbi:MAG: hypothetical protein A3E19_05675 [Planctomycetes bacterium RIFCSPHIGHO2_12_FULL_52_36]|nr:MAG: hypothetical protein A3E19_05675 [Planctomycetes bacterium RIFCSPHIGHO2_12_FULL_52_36]